MSRHNHDHNAHCEVGIIASFGRFDSRGKRIGEVRAESNGESLYFEETEAPYDIRKDEPVIFERGIFRTDEGNIDKAIVIRRISEFLSESWVRESCAASLDHRLWSVIAADHLKSLDAFQQIAWLKERVDSLSKLPDEGWGAVKPAVLHEADIWDAAPSSLRETRLRNAHRVIKEDFLNSCKRFRESPDSFPPVSEFKKMKISLVMEWAKRELELTLDEEQAEAVVAVDGDIQVVARAGSGKTRTLVTRAIFLQKYCKVSPNEILLLAFNKKAALQMKQRLQNALGNVLPHVMTFHALAYALVHPGEKLIYDDMSADQLGLSREVQEVIDEHIRSPKYGTRIQKLMLAHFREDWERIEEGRFILPMEEFLKHRRALPRETLNGEYVKSFGEKLIANALFEHDVEYRYESNFRWSGFNYRPDFMIGDHRNGGVIIEYFGLVGDPDYDEMSEEKRQFWARQDNWTLLEYTPHDIARQGQNYFGKCMLEELTRHNVEPRRLSEEEIWERVRKRAIDSFTKAMRQFVGRCRKLNLTENELGYRTEAHVTCSTAEQQFLQVGQSIYSGYVRRLSENVKEDFDGLMWRAISKVHDIQTRFARDRGREQGDLQRLRFIMVDECQDLSDMFVQLLQAIREHNSQVEFFCVGDDWQAINSFAGSDLCYFQNFKKYFWRNTSQVHIRTNWRSAKSIVHVGNCLMDSLGEAARPRSDAEPGKCLVGRLNEFSPTVMEQEQNKGDEITPAVLRVVYDCLKKGLDIVMLSRRNGLTWYVNYADREHNVDGLTRFKLHIRSLLPEGDRKRVTASTTHKYKGLEKEAVIVLDALEGSYPLVHPHWVFLRLFGDSVDSIIAEERRLFYVALTRAEKHLVLLTENKRQSQFLDEISKYNNAMNSLGVFPSKGLHQRRSSPAVQSVKWNELAPVSLGNGARLEIQVHNAFDVKDELKRQGFTWAGKFDANKRYWCKSEQTDGFDFRRDVLSQPWSQNSKVRIEVYSDTGELLHSSHQESQLRGNKQEVRLDDFGFQDEIPF